MHKFITGFQYNCYLITYCEYEKDIRIGSLFVLFDGSVGFRSFQLKSH
jgi:hypothetical protein